MIIEIVSLTIAAIVIGLYVAARFTNRSLINGITAAETRLRQTELDYETCRAALGECSKSLTKAAGDLEVAQSRLAAANESVTTWMRTARNAENRVVDLEGAVMAYHDVLSSPYGVNVAAIRQRLFDLVELEDPGDKIHEIVRVEVTAGDTVVARVPDDVSAAMLEEVVAAIRKRLPVEVEVLAIPQSMSFEVLGTGSVVKVDEEGETALLDLDEPPQFYTCPACDTRFGGDTTVCPNCGYMIDDVRGDDLDDSSTEGPGES